MRELTRAIVDACARFAREVWLYLALAALLTTIMTVSADIRDLAEISTWFVGNLLLSLSIAASMAFGFAITLRASYASAWPPIARVCTTLFVFVLCVAFGVELGLFAIRNVAPSLGPLFPRLAVLIVAVPVSLVMMGLGFLKERSERERQQRLRMERQLAETRLTALSARTEPHFLFNSLNSIVALVEEDPRAAERAIVELAAMFRYVLDGSRFQQVKLSDELSFVRTYLSLESLRFGARMQVSLEIEAGAETTNVPPLLLQPLIENAVRHGTSHSLDPVRITLCVRTEGAYLELSVDDDGPGPGGSQHRGSGTSHEDLRTRLALVYGAQASFETGASELGGFRALIRLPRGQS